jgi:hypothetical protein
MAIVEIPTRNDLPSYEMQVTLDSVVYTLQLYFNPRMADGVGKWFITLADQNRNMLVGPVPVVVNWGLFDRFIDQDGGSPPGTIFAFDTSGNNRDPGQFDLGDNVRLFYIQEGTTL